MTGTSTPLETEFPYIPFHMHSELPYDNRTTVFLPKEVQPSYKKSLPGLQKEELQIPNNYCITGDVTDFVGWRGETQ